MGYRSPAEILGHEVEHVRSWFEDPVQHNVDSAPLSPKYTSREEYQAIQVENQFARLIHGSKAIKRKHHGGEFVNARNGIWW